jgi:hypothetical protein
MLSVSGLITLGAAVVLVYILYITRGAGSIEALITAIPAALTALVTGILVLIWRESGANVRVARARVELLHRQRIRMLFLLGKHLPSEQLNLPALVAEANLMLTFIRVGSEPVTENSALPTSGPLPTPQS